MLIFECYISSRQNQNQVKSFINIYNQVIKHKEVFNYPHKHQYLNKSFLFKSCIIL